MPVVMPNFIVLSQTMYMLQNNFTYLWIKELQGHFLCKSSPVLEYSKARGLSICQLSSRSDDIFTRYLLPNFVDFVDSVTDKQQTTYLRIPCGEKK